MNREAGAVENGKCQSCGAELDEQGYREHAYGCDWQERQRQASVESPRAVMWARERDGSWHACAKGDPGAVRFEETP